MDPDRVAEENLHRQILFESSDIGRPKVEAAAQRLTCQYKDLEIEISESSFSREGHAGRIDGVDLVIEGSDDAQAKLEANALCVSRQRPVIIGGAIGYGGQIFVVPAGGRPCLNCLFGPDLDTASLATCATAGILGPVAGVIGAWMGRLADELVQGKIPGGLLLFEGRRFRQRWLPIQAQNDCSICARTGVHANPVLPFSTFQG